MSGVEPASMDRNADTGATMPGFGATGLSSGVISKARDYAPWILGLFLLGTIVDYGGGFHLKQAVFIFAMLYLFTRRRAYELWRRCLPDLAIVLLVPAGITLLHLLFSQEVSLEGMFGELWRRLGSPSYFMVFPLFLLVGVERTAKWLVMILAMLALATVMIMVAHIAGIIDIMQYSEFMMKHRLALFGTDLRAQDLGVADVGLPGFGAAQAFPAGFSLALALHPVLPVILALATVIGTQRGQVLGLVLAVCLMFFQTRGHLAARLWQFITRPVKALNLLTMAVLIVAAVAAAAYYMGDAISLLLYKYELLLAGQDDSSSVRLGHIAGYFHGIGVSPLGILWGFGPGASIYNPVIGEQIFMTEMVVLMYMFWYGWFYTLIFYFWIGHGLLGLLRRSRKRFDAALLTACAVLVVIGNINPVMLTPLAFIILALLRARLLELES